MTADLRAGIEALCVVDGNTLRVDGGLGGETPVIEIDDLRALLAAHPVQDEGAELDGIIPIGTGFFRPGVDTFIPHASVLVTAEGAVTITAIPAPSQVRTT